MTEYFVAFQKGTRVGARSTRRLGPIEANDSREAVALAKREFPDAKAQGYRLNRVDHFEGYHLVIDY